MDAVVAGQLHLVASVAVLEEYREVLDRLRHGRTSIEVAPLFWAIESSALIVEPAPLPTSACDDVDDIKFLACALAGRARCIVSGDKALLRATGFCRVEVLGPAVFVRRFLS